MGQVPCLASLAADREYFKPDAGDLYEEWAANLSAAEFDSALEELAQRMYPRSHGYWTPQQTAAFAAKYHDAIVDLAWENA